MSDRLPPQNIETEEAILGGILLDPKALDRIINELPAEAFYVEAHRKIYKAAIALHRNGQPTDLMTVSAYLADFGELNWVGGLARLAQLVDRTVSAINIDRYAALVMDKYLRRELSRTGMQIHDLAHDTTSELNTILYQSEQQLFQVSNRKQSSKTQPNLDVAIAAFNELENENPIYPTGIYDLDELIAGFEPGTLTILAGRPSMGKSFCAMFLTLQMIVKHELSVLFFSLEMTAKQLEYRLWSLLSVHPAYRHLNSLPLMSERIRQHRANRQKLSQAEMDTIIKVLGVATELPLYFNDDRGITVSGMASECRHLISEGKKLGLVVVDYLQMMASDTREGNRSYELGDVARELYKMAGDLNVPILALSQISRAVETRNNKRPTMADLSQSGILEMVADNIIMAYRDGYYNPDTPEREVLELIVSKSRHGSTGTVKCLFEQSYGLIKNMRG
ncbi:replicative DNA helicase [Chroococcus sp. FPU101]|uniref:replicative DNA helicase n=1 Tax=Chroococcus sp. FPU101 TaxID=1974212 RepID=UPI001AA524E4|nr:replicative DNA helicase [Chroococcus sp. FPU101]GFE72034.1 replicative DNA helicase [Chroococcus sp. FPU101]